MGIVGSGAVHVAVLDDYQDAALSLADWSRVTAQATVRSHRDHVDDEDELVARLAEAEIVVLMRERTPFPRSVFDRLPALRLLVTTGPKNAAVDMSAAADHSVTVCGTDLTTQATPELIWASVMALVRHLAAEDHAIRTGGWQTRLGIELDGSTLGIIGLGRLGQRVAGYAQVFGMNVLAWSEHLTDARAAEHGATRVELLELLERSDVVTIHLPLSARSRGLIGAAELAALGPDGYLVNTSRGPIVDEAALVEALHHGGIAGAALDVFDAEPLPPEHPLRTAPRTLLTPHVGFVSRQSLAQMYGQVVDDIAGWLAGSPVREIKE